MGMESLLKIREMGRAVKSKHQNEAVDFNDMTAAESTHEAPKGFDLS